MKVSNNRKIALTALCVASIVFSHSLIAFDAYDKAKKEYRVAFDVCKTKKERQLLVGWTALAGGSFAGLKYCNDKIKEVGCESKVKYTRLAKACRGAGFLGAAPLCAKLTLFAIPLVEYISNGFYYNLVKISAYQYAVQEVGSSFEDYIDKKNAAKKNEPVVVNETTDKKE